MKIEQILIRIKKILRFSVSLLLKPNGESFQRNRKEFKLLDFFYKKVLAKKLISNEI